LFPVIIVLNLRSALIFCIFEFDQLWLIALHMPTAYYGLANAILLSSIGLGSILVGRLKLGRYIRMLPVLALMLMGSLGLIFFRNYVAIIGSTSVFATSIVVIYIVFSRILHDNLHSTIRAGAASATNTLGRFSIIPIALLIGVVSQRFTIFHAGYILLVLAILLSLFVHLVARRNNYGDLKIN